MNNALITVDKQSVRVASNSLQEHLYSATKVTTESSWTELQEARRSLGIAQGMFNVLYELKLLHEWQIISENLIRIRLKLEDVTRNKQKASQMKMKRRKP